MARIDQACCLTCAKWALRHASTLRNHGYGICELAEPWEYFPPAWVCPKHEPAEKAVVDKRKVFLEKR